LRYSLSIEARNNVRVSGAGFFLKACAHRVIATSYSD